MQLPRKKTYNIAEAADLLGVSTKTLRRWDTSGKLSPTRSEGGHRRYLLKDLEKFIVKAPHLSTTIPANPIQPAAEVEFIGYPNLYDQMPLANKKLITRYAKVFTAILVAVIAVKFLLPSQYSQKISKTSKSGPSVLAAQALENPTFGINVDTVFRAGVNFLQGITTPNITVSGISNLTDITIDGVALTSTASQLNFVGGLDLTAGGIIYSTDADLATTAAGSTDQVLVSAGSGTPVWKALTDLDSTLDVDKIDSLDSAAFLRSNATDTYESGSTLTIAGTIDINSDILIADTSIVFDGASTAFAITGDLTLTPAGGDIIFSDAATLNIGGSGSDAAYNIIGDSITTASSAVASDDDLYIEGNLEVDGEITGSFAGSVNTGFTEGSVVFVNSSASLAADNTNFFWDDTNNRLGLGDNTPSYTLDVAGTANFTGTVTLGDTTADTITATGYIGSDLTPVTASTYDLGTNTRTWETLYVDNIIATNITTSGSNLNGTTASDFAINTDNATADTESATLTFDRGTPSVNSELRWDATVGRKWISTNASTFAINPLSETGITYSGKAALIVNQVQNQDLITASVSGTTRFKVDIDGEITASGIGRVKIIDGNEYAQTCAGINAAIDDLGSVGGEVFLPEGTYTCAETITIDYNNTTIRGAGKGSKIVVSAWASWSVPGHIINLNGMDHLTFSDFQIDGTLVLAGGQAFDLINGSGVTYSLFDSLYLKKGDRHGIDMTSGTYNKYINSTYDTFSDTSSTGITTTAESNSIISNNVFLSSYNGTSHTNGSYLTITGNTALNSTNNYGIGFDGGVNMIITGNTIYNSRVGIGFGSSPTGNTISGNSIYASGDYGIYAAFGTRYTITGNNIRDNAGAGDYGIYVNASYTTVSGNTVSEHSGAGDIGIWIAGGTDVVVSGNQLENNTSDITDAGTNTSIINSEDGNTVIGGADTSPDTTLELFRATGSDSTFSMTDGDVAHGVTTLANTDAILHIGPISSTVGGTRLTSFADADGQALELKGIQSSDPTDATPAVKIVAAKASGTGIVDLGAAETVFSVANNDDSAAITIFGDGSLVVGNPTGGAKGVGTINAVAVYDDNVILTDYVFDKYYDGTVRPDDLATHGDYQILSIDEASSFAQEYRHLPTIAGRDEWLASGKFSLGALVTDIWETAETNSLYIFELNDQVKNLANLNSPEQDNTQLLADIEDLRNSTDTRLADQENKINQLMADMDILKNQTLIATSSAMVAGVATESGTPNLTTLGDTVVTGKLNVGLLTLDSLSNSIDSIGELNIQKLALGNVKFFDGMIEFDTKGNIVTKEITAEKYTVKGDSAGLGVIPQGAKEIFINSTAVTDSSLIMVTPTTTTPYPLTVTQKVPGEGFKVEMSIWASENVTFDWFIVDHKEIN
ncbi:MAG: right-handed parallel beta-helix repeat-containing protein [Patescibacteria group bacterium]